MKDFKREQIDAILRETLKENKIDFLAQFTNGMNEMKNSECEFDENNPVMRETVILSLAYSNALKLVKDILYKICDND